jgi:hypothetical protein
MNLGPWYTYLLFSFTVPVIGYDKVECNSLQIQFNAPLEHTENTSQSLWPREVRRTK